MWSRNRYNYKPTRSNRHCSIKPWFNPIKPFFSRRILYRPPPRPLYLHWQTITTRFYRYLDMYMFSFRSTDFRISNLGSDQNLPLCSFQRMKPFLGILVLVSLYTQIINQVDQVSKLCLSNLNPTVYKSYKL